MARRGVLLDVDGTLVDTNWLHVVAWTRALRGLGVEVPMHVVHRHIGMGADQLVPAVAGREIEGAADAWAEEYAPLLAEVRALPGAGDLCRALHERGLAVVLASSAPAEHRDTFLAAIGAGGAVDVVTTADDAGASKPAPDIFAVALARAGLTPDEAICVGDSVWDVQAAARTGLGCVGVLTGGVDGRDLAAAGAVAVVEDCVELLAHLEVLDGS